MTRTSLEDRNCSLARTVDIIGDQWALLVLRDAFYGVKTFSSFQARLGMAKNVLTARLNRLTEARILDRVQVREGVDRFEYRLTEAGRDLFPVVVALVQWGDRWVFGPGQEPIRILDRKTESPVQALAVQARDGRVLAPRDITFEGGPGATPETLAALQTRRDRRS